VTHFDLGGGRRQVQENGQQVFGNAGAWLLAQKPFIVPIPGTRSADHLHENLGAIDVQLTSADLREIETALSTIEVHGGRMNEERMMAVDQTK
jgi:aryl-alcohol dehydrogenase-like predicted oxidoreductase